VRWEPDDEGLCKKGKFYWTVFNLYDYRVNLEEAHMKKHILKSTKHIFALTLIASFTLITFQPMGLSAAVFFQQTQREVVAGGIVYENRLQATSAGLINVSALFVDIHNPHVELRAIAPENFGTRASTRALVLESGAMAGINADFFDMGITQLHRLVTLLSMGELFRLILIDHITRPSS